MTHVRKLLLTLLLFLFTGLSLYAQNLINNGSFENGTGNNFTGWWYAQVSGSALFTAETSDVNNGARAFKVDVAALGANPWDVQFVHGTSWGSEAGKSYTLSFWAKGTANASFKAVVQGTGYQEKVFALTSTWQKYEWTFTATANNHDVKFQFLSTGTFYIDQISIPAPVVFKELISNGNLENGSSDGFTGWWSGKGAGAATFTAVTTDVKEGARALKVDVTALGNNPWDIQFVYGTSWGPQIGQNYTLSFWAKGTPGASFKAVAQGSGYLERTFTITSSTWQNYTWTFAATASDHDLKFQFLSAGTFYLDQISIPGSAEPVKLPDPYTPTGEPIAKGNAKFLGNIYSASQLPHFTNYWNQVTPENAGKWGSVEGTRDVMNWTQLDAAYNFAKNNGFPFRFHVLVWGNQQPSWIEILPAAEQLEEIREWYAAVAERYPDIAYIEVVNEPLHDAPRGTGNGNYIEALGGNGASGWDWVLTSFRMAREYFPNTKLVLNEYSVTNSAANAASYIQIIKLLQAEKLVDIVGIQAHAFETRVSAAETASNLNLIAAQGLPIMVTEFDIDGATDQVQLDDYKKIFTVFWEHPAVVGVTLWGWKPGMWRTDQRAFLAYENGAERPALVWLRTYVNNTKPVVTASQTFSVSEGAANGSSVGTVLATDVDAGASFQNWQITGGTGASLFAINAGTGAITVVDGTQLDFEATTSYTLTVSVSDGYHRSAAETLTVKLTNLNDNAPMVTAAQSFKIDGGACNELGMAVATDADDTNQAGYTTLQSWQIVGGNGSSIFAIQAATGMVSIANPLLIDFKRTSYTLMVTVGDGKNRSAAQVLTITIPEKITVCKRGSISISISKKDVPDHLKQGDCLGACSTEATAAARTATEAAEEELLQLNNISVYPNPAKDKLYVSLGANEQNISTIELWDLSGKLALKVNVNGNNNIDIPCQKLKPQLYLMRMRGDKVISRKVIIE